MSADNEELCTLAAPAAVTFMEEMRPKDGLEELALSQALLAHARASRLTMQLANHTTDATTLTAVSEAAERAANTLARLMRALREYREPMNATVPIAQVGSGKSRTWTGSPKLLKTGGSTKNQKCRTN